MEGTMAGKTFTQEQAAERLGVARTTLWRWQKKWAQSGELKVGKVRTGHNAGDWIYTEADIKAIEQWMDGTSGPAVTGG
jgi:predicted site-specific integrase-resolvase